MPLVLGRGATPRRRRLVKYDVLVVGRIPGVCRRFFRPDRSGSAGPAWHRLAGLVVALTLRRGRTIDRLARERCGSTRRSNHAEFLWRSMWREQPHRRLLRRRRQRLVVRLGLPVRVDLRRPDRPELGPRRRRQPAFAKAPTLHSRRGGAATGRQAGRPRPPMVNCSIASTTRPTRSSRWTGTTATWPTTRPGT